MAYLDDLLARGERIVYIGRQHIVVLVSNIVAELCLIAVLIAAGVAAQAAFRNELLGSVAVGQAIFLGSLIISIAIILSAIMDYLRWMNEMYVVTDDRVIQIRGVLSKQVIDSSLEKINDVELEQSWLGRMLDYGDIQILTAAETGVSAMRRMAHPLEFKKMMMEAKHEHSRGFGYLDPQAVAAYADAVTSTRRSRRNEQ